MPKSIRDRLIAALKERGWDINENHVSRKYVVMTKVNEIGNFYLGKSGALRFGVTIGESHPQDRNKARLLKDGEKK